MLKWYREMERVSRENRRGSVSLVEGRSRGKPRKRLKDGVKEFFGVPEPEHPSRCEVYMGYINCIHMA